MTFNCAYWLAGASPTGDLKSVHQASTGSAGAALRCSCDWTMMRRDQGEIKTTAETRESRDRPLKPRGHCYDSPQKEKDKLRDEHDWK